MYVSSRNCAILGTRLLGNHVKKSFGLKPDRRHQSTIRRERSARRNEAFKHLENDLRSSSNNQNEGKNTAIEFFNQFPNYCLMVKGAKAIARRSVLIKHWKSNDFDLAVDLRNVEHIYQIERNSRHGLERLSLVEFESEEEANNFIGSATHQPGSLPISMSILQTFLSLRPNDLLKGAIDYSLRFPTTRVRLNDTGILDDQLTSLKTLLSRNMMSLVALKLRFLTLVNMEQLLCAGAFRNFELMPFGSSVIDIGCDSGDLDLVMTPRVDHSVAVSCWLKGQKNQANPIKVDSRLMHFDKNIHSERNEQSLIRDMMRLCEDLIRHIVPLTSENKVLSLPHARVPIIKFKSEVTNIDMDLSFNLELNLDDSLPSQYSGIVMSQLLYALCRHNNLFTAVVVYFRLFARSSSVAAKGGNRLGFTNFQLLSLVMFYLQQISVHSDSSRGSVRKIKIVKSDIARGQHPIVPPLKELMNENIKSSGLCDLTDEEVRRLLPDIIKGFFDYYSEFDFMKRAIDPYESRIERKPDLTAIYVRYPLNRDQNMCYSVHRRGLENFLRQIRTAASKTKPSESSILRLIADLQAEASLNESKMLLGRAEAPFQDDFN